MLFLFWAISIGIICGAGLYVLAIVLCVVVTLGLFITDKMARPAGLTLIVVSCRTLDDADHITEILKSHTSFLRIKNKTVYPDNIELIFEYKTKDDASMEKTLNSAEEVKSFSIMNYDRETRI